LGGKDVVRGSLRSSGPNALAVYLLLAGERERLALLCRALRISPAFGLDVLKFGIPVLQLVTALASAQPPTNLDAWQATTKMAMHANVRRRERERHVDLA